MISDGYYHQDFKAFFPPLERVALGLKYSHILLIAQQYHKLGLPQAALRLYAQVDTPESLASIAAYNAFGSMSQGVRFEIDPSNPGSIDYALQSVKEEMMMPPEEAARQAWLNAEAAGRDPSLISNIEILVASARAVSYLRVNDAEEAIKQAERISPFTNNADAQYIAAMVYSSQGMTDKAIAKLDELARLARQHPINFPDTSYFDAIRSTSTFKELRISRVFTDYPAVALWAKLEKKQLAKLDERVNIWASEGYKALINRHLSHYVEHNADLGIERNDNSYFRNAETAANKAAEILGMNGDTANLLAIVYNRTNQHDAAAALLLEHKDFLSPKGLFEFALALKLTGNDKGAYQCLEQALHAQPGLWGYTDRKPYSILNGLSSQPGFEMLMVLTKAIIGPSTS